MFLYNSLNISFLHNKIHPLDTLFVKTNNLYIYVQNSSGKNDHQQHLKWTAAVSTSNNVVIKVGYNGFN